MMPRIPYRWQDVAVALARGFVILVLLFFSLYVLLNLAVALRLYLWGV